MLESNQSLTQSIFKQVDEETIMCQLKINKLHMNLTQMTKDIRDMSRLHLLIEVLQRVHRMLNPADQAHYAADFSPYLQESSMHYIYHFESEEVTDHIWRINQLMRELVEKLAVTYAHQPDYKRLMRVFNQDYFVKENSRE